MAEINLIDHILRALQVAICCTYKKVNPVCDYLYIRCMAGGRKTSR